MQTIVSCAQIAKVLCKENYQLLYRGPSLISNLPPRSQFSSNGWFVQRLCIARECNSITRHSRLCKGATYFWQPVFLWRQDDGNIYYHPDLGK